MSFSGNDPSLYLYVQLFEVDKLVIYCYNEILWSAGGKGFNLDMTYYNIIAMGFHAGVLSSRIFGYFQGFYRNHMVPVWLLHTLIDKNLCKERRRGYGALSGAHSTVICRAVRATCREATVPGDDVSGRRLVRTRHCCAGRRGSRAGRRRGCLAASCAAVEDTSIQGSWWPWMRGGHVIGSRDCRDTGVGWGFPNFPLPVKHSQPM